MPLTVSAKMIEAEEQIAEGYRLVHDGRRQLADLERVRKAVDEIYEGDREADSQ